MAIFPIPFESTYVTSVSPAWVILVGPGCDEEASSPEDEESSVVTDEVLLDVARDWRAISLSARQEVNSTNTIIMIRKYFDFIRRTSYFPFWFCFLPAVGEQLNGIIVNGVLWRVYKSLRRLNIPFTDFDHSDLTVFVYLPIFVL
jgi:hypothetical protein